MSTVDRAAVVIVREAMQGHLTWADLRALLPGIADPTIDKAIALLIGTGVIERVARIPRVTYGWTGVDLPECLGRAAEEVDRGVRISPRIVGAELREVLADRDRPIEQVAREHGVSVSTIRRLWGRHP